MIKIATTLNTPTAVGHSNFLGPMLNSHNEYICGPELVFKAH